MITLQKMVWSNWFSYGEDNNIDFENCNLTQLIGENGVGKSAIIHILEEILYNKNSRGTKKSELMNRNKSDLSAELYFKIYDIQYIIKIKRKTTAKVSLYKDGIDISSHTATNTFKDIQKIIGLDFPTFTQLVYQNSKQGLDFLTSPDSARKKFLTNLFNLNKYTNYYDHFKSEYNKINMSLKELEGKQTILTEWVNKHKDMDFTVIKLKDEIENTILDVYIKDRAELSVKSANIDYENKKILKNNRSIDYFNNLNKPDDVIEQPIIDVTLSNEKAVLHSSNVSKNAIIRDLQKLTEHLCPTCLQHIDEDIKENMLTEAQKGIIDNNIKIAVVVAELSRQESSNMIFKKKTRDKKEYDLSKDAIDYSLETKLYAVNDISEKINDIDDKYNKLKQDINKILSFNKDAIEKNARLSTILADLEQNKKDLQKVKSLIIKILDDKSIYNILKTVFSTKGIISYKIDFLVKDLQDSINEYLVKLSSGNFQLNFVLSGDSINIAIIDNGLSVNITSLSTGELARVNIATLLAIRKLMSSISNTKINVLFLDEILGVLDETGKNILIDILLEEKGLNTFIVSHEYTHPLLDKLYVIKQEGGSKIE